MSEPEIFKPHNSFGLYIFKPKTIPKWFSLFMIFLIITSTLQAQHRGRVFYTKNAAFAEFSFLRYQGIASLNYERTFYYSRGVRFTGTTGIGAFYTSANTGEYNGFSLPLSFNLILGNSNNHFEASLGAGYRFGSNINNDISPFSPLINIGYRYQQLRGKRLIYRVFVGTNGIGVGVGKGF
jgi:hypothetical protein